MSITAESITESIVGQMLQKLISMDPSLTGGYPVDKIEIVANSPGGQLADISTEDADESGKPDVFRIYLDKVVEATRSSVNEWLEVHPDMITDMELGDINMLDISPKPLVAILATILTGTSLHEAEHGSAPPISDSATNTLIPQLTEEGPAEVAGAMGVDKLMNRLYSKFTPEVLGYTQDDSSQASYAKLHDELSSLNKLADTLVRDNDLDAAKEVVSIIDDVSEAKYSSFIFRNNVFKDAGFKNENILMVNSLLNENGYAVDQPHANFSSISLASWNEFIHDSQEALKKLDYNDGYIATFAQQKFGSPGSINSLLDAIKYIVELPTYNVDSNVGVQKLASLFGFELSSYKNKGLIRRQD